MMQQKKSQYATADIRSQLKKLVDTLQRLKLKLARACENSQMKSRVLKEKSLIPTTTCPKPQEYISQGQNASYESQEETDDDTSSSDHDCEIDPEHCPSLICSERNIEFQLHRKISTIGYICTVSDAARREFQAQYDIIVPLGTLHRAENFPVLSIAALKYPAKSTSVNETSNHANPLYVYFIKRLSRSVEVSIERYREASSSWDENRWIKLNSKRWIQFDPQQCIHVHNLIYQVIPPGGAQVGRSPVTHGLSTYTSRKLLEVIPIVSCIAGSPEKTKPRLFRTQFFDQIDLSAISRSSEWDSSPLEQTNCPKTISSSLRKDGTSQANAPTPDSSLPEGITILRQRNSSFKSDVQSSIDQISSQSQNVLPVKRFNNEDSQRKSVRMTSVDNDELGFTGEKSRSAIVIATSGINMTKKLEQKLLNIGITIRPLYSTGEFQQSQCSVLVVPNAPVRTIKLLCAMNFGKHILPFQWLSDCAKRGYIISDFTDYLIAQSGIERKYSFSMKASIQRSLAMRLEGNSLFSGKRIFVAEGLIQHSPGLDSDIVAVLLTADATMEMNVSIKPKDEIFCIVASNETRREIGALLQCIVAKSNDRCYETPSDPFEHNTRAAMRRRRVSLEKLLPPVVSTEWVYCSVLRQEILDVGPYAIEINVFA